MRVSKSTLELEIKKILAVRAAEENSKRLLKPMAVSAANISAIGAKSDGEFIGRRADHLFGMLPQVLRTTVRMNLFGPGWLKATLLASFVAGLLSNYLGPSQFIHVVYNPLTILLAWTILIYLFMIVKLLWKPTERAKRKWDEVSRRPAGQKTEDENRQDGKEHQPNLFERIAGWVYQGFLRLKIRYVDDSLRATLLKEVMPAYWAYYTAINGRSLMYRFRSLSNAAAASLLAGAVAGIYFRGLFFQYNIIWQSTFVSEPVTILKILNALFGPASLLIQGKLIQIEAVYSLLQPEGTLAGPWIHLMVLTVFLAVFIPRTILSMVFHARAKKRMGQIDFTEPYYQETVKKNRESLIGIIREGIREIISKKIDTVSRKISEFVIRDYYEEIIEPLLVSFREKGGRIRKLEGSLLASQQQFEPILLNYLKEVQEEFRESILDEINLFMGRKLQFDIDTETSYQPRSDELDRKLSGRLAADIGDTIGGTIVTTISLAVGTVSGGIGKSLGIAIISGLLGVSGPVGLLIGGVITAVTLGGFYQMKREQISGMIKDIPLPAMVTSVTLTEGRIQRTRKETYDHTNREIHAMLTPKIDEVTDTILKDLTY